MEGQILYDNGACLIQILDTQEEVDNWRRQIEQETLAGFELDPGAVQRISQLQGGSFGALGTPTSFHGKYVRRLRRYIARVLRKLGFFQSFSELAGVPNVEILIDRLREQLEGTSVGGEAYHRDESTHAKEGDVILGGWLNLSADPQTVQSFSYLKGTQLRKNAKRGHAKSKPTKKQLQQADTLTVKPGQLVLFYQNILHQVHRPAGGKLASDSTRLHYGVRFTSETDPLFPLDRVFAEFASPKLPSGQPASLWPKLYWVNHLPKLMRLSRAYKQRLLVTRQRKGEDVTAIPSVLDTPVEDRGNFEPYGDEEQALYKPTQIRVDPDPYDQAEQELYRVKRTKIEAEGTD